jgi:hypothetical protein
LNGWLRAILKAYAASTNRPRHKHVLVERARDGGSEQIDVLDAAQPAMFCKLTLMHRECGVRRSENLIGYVI